MFLILTLIKLEELLMILSFLHNNRSSREHRERSTTRWRRRRVSLYREMPSTFPRICREVPEVP